MTIHWEYVLPAALFGTLIVLLVIAIAGVKEYKHDKENNHDL